MKEINQSFLHRKVIILGSGPAGCTSAIYTARAGLNPILITGLQKGGQISLANSVENWTGLYDKQKGSSIMKNTLKQLEKFMPGSDIIEDSVHKVNLIQRPFLLFGNFKKYSCDALIIATGSSFKKLGSSFERKFNGRGISFCATCDGFFYKDQKVAVIGGGNNAIEEAIYLSKISKEVNLVHRRKKFRAEKFLINKMYEKIEQKKIFLHTNFIICDVQGDERGVKSMKIRSNLNGSEKNISVSGIFIAIGSIPNTDIFVNQLDLENGYIRTRLDRKCMTETSIEGVFAAGDVSDNFYRQAISSAGTGCMAAIDAEKYLSRIT
ncbi:FAD-dependent oxidoreductase [Candidatus Riesia pediculischaeffi]|uniref:Thioredoxin reductase n=1 Tax=Candidatus Riesia pediculischaeffi PTSU TaxID=1401651 RepID=A0A0C1V634_9ENTR|nr:FAD-dependent oxidoreductase [Candidatus Riesia pediculischaeffi]KIE63884.1 Thioredoxin reductase [Candidatus Riesia pediculischaeffi PTSU]